MEDEIRILFNNMRLMGTDLTLLQKATRVQINSQMFQKANHKGMALLVHTLLCLFDPDKIKAQFANCWFPYSMVEMREFKLVAAKVCDDLTLKQKLGATDLTKGVMETAAGVRMWQALRAVSDAALFEKLKSIPNIMGKGLPQFKLTKASILIDSEDERASAGPKSRSLAMPSKANICPRALDRACRSLQSFINQQEKEFTQKCIGIHGQQQNWKHFAAELSRKYHTEKVNQTQMHVEGKKTGLMDHHGRFTDSQLAQDLRESGIQIIEQLPQIGKARQSSLVLSQVPEMLEKDNLSENLSTIFKPANDDEEAQPTLTQELILGKVEDQDFMMEKLKYDYSDKVLSVDTLITATADKFNSLLIEIEEGRLTDEILSELDMIAERHKETIAQLKHVNSKLKVSE